MNAFFEATVIEFDESKGKYIVNIGEPNYKSLKRDNLNRIRTRIELLSHDLSKFRYQIARIEFSNKNHPKES